MLDCNLQNWTFIMKWLFVGRVKYGVKAMRDECPVFQRNFEYSKMKSSRTISAVFYTDVDLFVSMWSFLVLFHVLLLVIGPNKYWYRREEKGRFLRWLWSVVRKSNSDFFFFVDKTPTQGFSLPQSTLPLLLLETFFLLVSLLHMCARRLYAL